MNTPSPASKNKLPRGEWFDRVKACAETKKEHIEVAGRITDFIKGGKKFEDKSKSQKWAMSMVNLYYPLIRSLVPAILHRNPETIVRPTDPLDEAQRIRARVDTLLLKYIDRETKKRNTARLCLIDSLLHGLSGAEHLFDSGRRITFSRFRSFLDLFWDIEGDGTQHSLRWVAVDFSVPLEWARKQYKNPAMESNLNELAQRDGLPVKRPLSLLYDGSGQPMHTPEGERPDALKRIKLTRVYVRGDDPEIMDQDAESRDNRTETIKPSDKYFTKNEIVIMDRVTGDVYSREPWPYVLDEDEFPVTFLRPWVMPGEFNSMSVLRPALPTQEQINWARTFNVNRMRQGAQSKILYDLTVIDPKKQHQLLSPNDMEAIGCNNFQPNAVKVLELGGISETALRMAQELNNDWRDITGYAELISSGIREADSATEAAIANDASQLSTAMIQDNSEDFMTDCARKELQMAKSLMTADDVARCIGADALGNKSSMTVDIDGEPKEVVEYEAWPENLTPREIRSETDVEVLSGSTRKVNPDEVINNTLMLADRVTQTVQALETDPRRALRWESKYRMLTAPLVKVARELDMPDLLHALPKEDDFEELPPEPPAPAAQDGQGASLPMQMPDSPPASAQPAPGLPLDASLPNVEEILASMTPEEIAALPPDILAALGLLPQGIG